MGLFGKKEKSIEEIVKIKPLIIRGLLYDYVNQHDDDLSKHAALTYAKIDAGIRLLNSDAKTLIDILTFYIQKNESEGITSDNKQIISELRDMVKKLNRFL